MHIYLYIHVSYHLCVYTFAALGEVPGAARRGSLSVPLAPHESREPGARVVRASERAHVASDVAAVY